MRLALSALAAALLLVACGGEETLPQKPQLKVDRTTIDFGSLAGRAVFVGTEPQDSMQITNGGLENLKINSVTKEGDPEFRIEGPLKTDLKGKETTFITVFFKPSSAKHFTGKLQIDTNTELHAGQTNPLEITLQGDGAAPLDAGQ